MAKTETTQVTLRHSVVFGAGVKARTEAAGATLTLPRDVADELIAGNAAVLSVPAVEVKPEAKLEVDPKAGEQQPL
jgi:hypothetical protein